MDMMSECTSPCQTAEVRLQQLSKLSHPGELSPALSIQQYLRAIHSMLQMIDSHINGNRMESAYVLALRFLTLFLELLPKHKEYHQIVDKDMALWKDRCRNTIIKAEMLKNKLQQRFTDEHDEYVRLQEEEKAKMLAEEKAELNIEQHLPKPPSSPPPVSPKPMGSSNLSLGSFSYPSLNATKLETHVTERPAIDRSLKPQSNSSSHYLLPLRMSFRLADRFLQVAKANTDANRETCASLCGKLVNNEYHITDVVITKQSGTPDSCTTYNEEELFNYMEQKNLIILGWIHTHPSQSAFLSSVDQHTQLSYQMMLPEAIAIVCAPKFNKVVAYSLNPDSGIQFVRQCKNSGFHPHPKSIPIYERSSHVIHDPNVSFTVVDLR